MVKKYLYFESGQDQIIDIILATVIANKIGGDPVWMLIIGPPSSAKTELLRGLHGLDVVHFLSTVTPSTFISGMKTEKKEVEPSLLPKLDGKVLVIKDFTSILSTRSENRQEILAQLREIHDGSISKAFGTGKQFEWEGKLGLLGACAPVYDKHYRVIATMGDRFMLARINNSDPIKTGEKARANVGREKEMRDEIAYIFKRFLDQFRKTNLINPTIDDDYLNKIISLASFCAYSRCQVERDYKTRQPEYLPQPEGTGRLMKQFIQIGMGLTLTQGKISIDGKVFCVLKKIAMDLVSVQRLMALEFLFRNYGQICNSEPFGRGEIAENVGIPQSTLRFILEDLMSVGLVEYTTDATVYASGQWALSEMGFKLIQEAEIFDE